MTASTETVPIGELCEKVVSGGTPRRRNPSYYGGRIPWVKTMDLNDGPVTSTNETLTKLGLAESSAKLLPVGSVLIAMYGGPPTGGRLGYLEVEAACNQAACGLVPDPSKADDRWVFYALLYTRDRLTRLASGAAQQNLNVSMVREHQVPVHSLSHQRAIADVLRALDDKIAVNRQVLSTGLGLIDAAYAAARKARGRTSIEDVAVLGGGGTPSTKDASLWNHEHHWATPSDVTGMNGPWLLDTARHISAAGLRAITSKLYPRRTILMTSRASIGHCALAAAPTAVNQGFIAIQAKEEALQTWLFAQMRSRTTEFLAWANGATFLELPKGIFKSLPVDLPTEEALGSFRAASDGVLDRLEAAQAENDSLAATRDELLPLLMSGRITVKDAERRVEDEV